MFLGRHPTEIARGNKAIATRYAECGKSADRYGLAGIIAHRPETGTPLKNKERGEREVHVKRNVCKLIDDYLQFNHAGVGDEFGRMPLFSMRSGRAFTTALRKNV